MMKGFRLAAAGIRAQEKKVLETLGGTKGNLPGDLKAAIEKHGIGQDKIERMLRAGYIEKQNVPGAQIYRITEKGRKYYARWLIEKKAGN